jgi:hypothetical protein
MVRIFAYDRFKPGVTLETIEPYLPEEVAMANAERVEES